MMKLMTMMIMMGTIIAIMLMVMSQQAYFFSQQLYMEIVEAKALLMENINAFYVKWNEIELLLILAWNYTLAQTHNTNTNKNFTNSKF